MTINLCSLLTSLLDDWKSIGRGDEDALLPLDMYPQELQQGEQYANLVIEAEDDDVLPTIEFDAVDFRNWNLDRSSCSLCLYPSYGI